jgi:DNA-binding transcriptional ArsR family regulator
MSRAPGSEPAALRRARAAAFAALGDPTRLSLVARLCGGPPCSIAQLTQHTKLTRQAITKHLRVLESARIVHGTRFGRESRFAFNPQPIEDLKTYLHLVSAQWDDALARLRALVEG